MAAAAGYAAYTIVLKAECEGGGEEAENDEEGKGPEYKTVRADDDEEEAAGGGGGDDDDDDEGR